MDSEPQINYRKVVYYGSIVIVLCLNVITMIYCGVIISKIKDCYGERKCYDRLNFVTRQREMDKIDDMKFFSGIEIGFLCGHILLVILDVICYYLLDKGIRVNERIHTFIFILFHLSLSLPSLIYGSILIDRGYNLNKVNEYSDSDLNKIRTYSKYIGILSILYFLFFAIHSIIRFWYDGILFESEDDIINQANLLAKSSIIGQSVITIENKEQNKKKITIGEEYQDRHNQMIRQVNKKDDVRSSIESQELKSNQESEQNDEKKNTIESNPYNKLEKSSSIQAN